MWYNCIINNSLEVIMYRDIRIEAIQGLLDNQDKEIIANQDKDIKRKTLLIVIAILVIGIILMVLGFYV